LPAILIVSSDLPRMYHCPSESIAAKSPCTHTPGQRPIRLFVRAGHARSRVMPIRAPDDRLTDLVAPVPGSSKTSAAIPGAGAARRSAGAGAGFPSRSAGDLNYRRSN
jgi:hypothetical protein